MKYLLCEAAVDHGVDVGDRVLWRDGDGRRLVVADLGEGRHVMKCRKCSVVNNVDG